MSGGGGSKTQTTVQKTEPWKQQIPFLTYGFDEAKKQYTDVPKFFNQSTVVPFSAETNAALAGQFARAKAGSPFKATTNQALNDTISGKYLHGGAGFDAALQAASNKILPQIESRFASGGRYGSGLARQAEAQALGDAFAGQYAQERANQMSAMAMTPQMAQMDYLDFAKMGEVGAQREQLQQDILQEKANKWNFEQNAKRQNLADYMNLIQGNYGQTGSSTAPQQSRNRVAGALGGALSGAAAGSVIPGVGTLMGGAIGGLAGAFM